MIYIFVITYILFFIINTMLYKKKINLLNTIDTIWVSITILSMFGFYDMYIPDRTTYIYILYFLYSINVFSWIFNKFVKTKNKKNKNEFKDIMLYKKTNLIFMLVIIILIPFMYNSMKIIFNGGTFSNVRDAYLNCEVNDNKLQMFISLMIVPLGNAIGIYSIIISIQNKKVNTTNILYAFFLLENIIFTGGRSIIVNLAIIMIIILLDNYNNIIKLIKNNKKIIVILGVIIFTLGIITLQRNLRGKGLLYNLYCYSVGNIHLLGKYVKNPQYYLLTKENILYGQILISGFAYPVTFLLRLLGIDVKAGLYILNEITQKYVQISSDTTINNSVTVIVYALRDFGTVGIFIYSAIIAFFYNYLKKKKEKNGNILNKAIYYYFIKCAIFLFSEFQFANSATIFTFIYFIIIYKLCFYKDYYYKGCENKDDDKSNITFFG